MIRYYKDINPANRTKAGADDLIVITGGGSWIAKGSAEAFVKMELKAVGNVDRGEDDLLDGKKNGRNDSAKIIASKADNYRWNRFKVAFDIKTEGSWAN